MGETRKSKVCATKMEAERALRAMLADADAGLVLRDVKLTVGEYLEHWLPTRTKLRSETIKS